MSWLAFLAFNGLLGCAAASDLRTFRIPNVLPLLVAAAGLVLHLPLTPAEWLDRGAAVVLVGVGGGILWLRGLFGGGDYKLIWACALWTGLAGFTPFALAFGLASGVQGLSALLIAQATARRGAPLRSRLGGRVPLAVSIAAAGLYWSLLQSPAGH
jgi:prepilin peptidase CpaA